MSIACEYPAHSPTFAFFSKLNFVEKGRLIESDIILIELVGVIGDRNAH